MDSMRVSRRVDPARRLLLDDDARINYESLLARSLARRDDDDDAARLARWMHPRVAHSGESSTHARGAIGDRPTHSIDPIDPIDEIDRSNDRWTDRSPIDRSWIHSWVTNGHRRGSEHPLRVVVDEGTLGSLDAWWMGGRHGS